MHVLLTNDDGIDAVGIRVLRETLGPEIQWTVVAPHQGYSGCGHQVTNHGPIQVNPRDDRHYQVVGTPADCVRLGLTEIAPSADWVLSGINAGANLGVDLVMSGTVAAAREAVWLGKPAMALSQYLRRDVPRDWGRTADMAKQVIQALWERPLPAHHFWNVNFPDGVAPGEARLEDAFPEPQHLHVEFARSEQGYEYRGDYRQRPRTPGSDVDHCFGGNIAVSAVPARP